MSSPLFANRFTLVLFFAIVAFSVSAQAADPAARLEALFPGFQSQVAALQNDAELRGSVGWTQAVQALADWVGTTPDANMVAALRAVLRPEIAAAQSAAAAFRFIADGRATEWAAAPYASTDYAGDAGQGRGAYDVVSARAVYDGNGLLSLQLATAQRPGPNQALQFFVDCVGDSEWDLNVYFVVDAAGSGRGYWNLMPNGEGGELAAGAYAVGEIAELQIGLRSAFPGRSFKPLLTIQPSSYASSSNAFDAGMNLFVPAKPLNFSLLLLLHLALNNCVDGNDTMAAAMALVNSWLFMAGDVQVRANILRDVTRHYAFYRVIREAQTASGVTWALARSPYLAQAFWADRSSYYERELRRQMDRFDLERLNLDLYLDYVDRVENLEAIRALVVREDLSAPSLEYSCRRLEDYVSWKRNYRSSMEFLRRLHEYGSMSEEDLAQAERECAAGEYTLSFRGESRRWDEFWWLNYQWRLFRDTGRFRGDCGTTTVVMMSFYRAAGIAPLSFQYIDAVAPDIYTHNFPAHYDPSCGRWFATQTPGNGVVPAGTTSAPKPVFLYFIKPTVNFRRPSEWFDGPAGYNRQYNTYYQGDVAEISRIANFLRLGWTEASLEAVAFSDRTLEPNLFLTPEAAPAALPDADSDGLCDALETARGTNPRVADSDGDGLADGFEVYGAGTDPRSASSPAASAWVQRPIIETTDLLGQLGIEPVPMSAGLDVGQSDTLTFSVRVREGTVFTHNVSGVDGAQIDNFSYETRENGVTTIRFVPLTHGEYFVNLLYRQGDNPDWRWAGRYRVIVLRDRVPAAPANVRSVATVPYYNAEALALGIRFLSRDAGRFALTGGPAELRWEAPENILLGFGIVDANDREVRGFRSVRHEGRAWILSLLPSGMGTFRLNCYYSTDGGTSYNWASSQTFEGAAASPLPAEGNVTPLAPLPYMEPDAARHGVTVVTPNRGQFRIASGEVRVDVRVPGADRRLWVNVFGADNTFIQGYDMVRRNGEIWTICVYPPRAGSYYVNFGIVYPDPTDAEDGETGVQCGRFDFETLETPTWPSGRNWQATSPYPYYDQQFFSLGLTMATPNRGAFRITRGPAEILEITAPAGFEIAESFFTPDGSTVINEQASVTRRGNAWVVTVNPRDRGEYRLSLFAVRGGEWIWVGIVNVTY